MKYRDVSIQAMVFRRLCVLFLCSRHERPRLQGPERGSFPPPSAPRRYSVRGQVDVVTA